MWFGKKKEEEEGWMIVLWVKFQVGDQVGGGQGTPFRAQVGLGRERELTSNGRIETISVHFDDSIISW